MERESDFELAACFPASFLWGAATAAYQIEGATSEDGRGPSIWDVFSATPGKIHGGDTGEIGADHYHLMERDVELMANLGPGAYRFSIAWPRIRPSGQGRGTGRGIGFYGRLVGNRIEHGITPVATVYRWDLPQTLQDDGGWLNRGTAQAFADYVEAVARRLGDRVTRWITLNEPWCAAYLGYGTGVHAPGASSMRAAVTAAHHLLLAHGLAVPCIRTLARPDAQVGITLNLTPVYAADGRDATLRAQRQADRFHNRWFLDPIFRGRYPAGLFGGLGVPPPAIESDDLAAIAAPIDFLGVNYYSRLLIRGNDGSGHQSRSGPYPDGHIVGPVPGSSYTGMGWEIYPEGLVDILLAVHHDYRPRAIAVTENGAAFDDVWNGDDVVRDARRLANLREHVQAMAVGLMVGVPVEGYFAWSVMGNFEWAEGYSRRFGMVYIDYPSQRRVVKDSGRWFAELLALHRAQRMQGDNSIAIVGTN